MSRSLSPAEAWELAQRGELEILDLRTEAERRHYGAPPGAKPVSLPKHMLRPEGAGVVYLCQHEIRSKATLHRGACDIAGGFSAWRDAGLPVERVGDD